MNLDTPAHQLAWSLLIGAEVFAVAALWPLSEWAATASRGRGFLAALLVAASCIGFDMHALAFARLFDDPGRWATVDRVLAWLVIPLFVAFPDAVCVASAQSLRRAGVSEKIARAVALAIAAVAVVVAPIAAIGAGCGFAGVCR